PARAGARGRHVGHYAHLAFRQRHPGNPSPMSPASPLPRYAVIGNPVAHSRSPQIHAMFSAQTGKPLQYERLLAPLDGFAATVQAFREQGGVGLNVTVPFKEAARDLAGEQDRKSTRLNSSHVKTSYAVFCLRQRTASLRNS